VNRPACATAGPMEWLHTVPGHFKAGRRSQDFRRCTGAAAVMLRAILQHIAHAAHGVQQLGREGVVELGAQRRTATSTTLVSESKFMSHTCSASVVRDRIWPRRRSSSASRLNSLAVRSSRCCARVALRADQVELQVAQAQLRGRLRTGRRTAAQQRAHTGQQLREGKGLDEVVVGALLQPAHAVLDLVARREHQHRRVAAGARSAAARRSRRRRAASGPAAPGRSRRRWPGGGLRCRRAPRPRHGRSRSGPCAGTGSAWLRLRSPAVAWVRTVPPCAHGRGLRNCHPGVRQHVVWVFKLRSVVGADSATNKDRPLNPPSMKEPTMKTTTLVAALAVSIAASGAAFGTGSHLRLPAAACRPRPAQVQANCSPPAPTVPARPGPFPTTRWPWPSRRTQPRQP
jgi:hypothetical protein